MRTLMISLIALSLGGCSSSATRSVSGQLDLTQMRLSNAQVVAISSTGRVFRAPIAQNGTFSIALPAHAAYTMRFANATNVPERFDAFATLTPHRPSGATHWFTLTPGGNINLGLVSRAAAGAARPTSGLTTMSDPSESGDSSSGMSGEQEDDGADACDVSSGSDDADVQSQNDLNDSVDSNHDGTPDSADTSSDATCSASANTSGGDDCEVSDSQGKELDDSANQPCNGGGLGGGTPVTPSPGLI